VQIKSALKLILELTSDSVFFLETKSSLILKTNIKAQKLTEDFGALECSSVCFSDLFNIEDWTSLVRDFNLDLIQEKDVYFLNKKAKLRIQPTIWENQEILLAFLQILPNECEELEKSRKKIEFFETILLNMPMELVGMGRHTQKRKRHKIFA